MFIIVPLFIVLLLKVGDVWIFASMSWWWIIGAAGAAFVWFEFLERMLGLDKRKDHAHFEKIQKERVKRTFDKTTKRR
ncbi:TIGR04438 family Trp-rich protein [Undibacterium umbellatum]|uniref:TIGR04438 family Trp-rich protein n=1 Tax=Undibacterium umbellatum TaxID=2762300 RepID=A0ABR6ZBY1_9BURK|nr:TIGR04438 family Trp-rich protein [Undibacterium umbellatum]MBC3909267.1 TIGR04438 family Trp-rich protein [Undibacterium umbellatum]